MGYVFFGGRRFFSSLAVLLLCQACSSVQIPGLGSVGGTGGTEGGGGGGIVGEADSFQKYTAFGTMNLLTALSEVGLATGRKEEAAHYSGVADTIKQGSMSTDTYKKAEPLISNPAFKPEETALVHTAEGRKHLRDSFIYFSIGSYMDKKASTAAQVLLQSKPSPVELANGTVSGAMEVLKVGKDALPKHVTTAGKWLATLTAYMKANKMPIPTNAEIKKIAEKEVKDHPELLADFPTS